MTDQLCCQTLLLLLFEQIYVFSRTYVNINIAIDFIGFVLINWIFVARR